jgi:hypothetical protein
MNTNTPAQVNADLGPLRLKLARAKTRMDELRSAVDSYLAGDPCRIEEVSSGTKYSLRTFVDTAPDDAWVMDVAEISGHARSVLDQLVWQLVLANGQDPNSFHTQFPISTDHDSYARGKKPKREQMLAGVARKHRRIIDNYQPYQSGSQATRHPLYILNQVVNSEKHKAGHAVIASATECRARLVRPGEEEAYINFHRAMPLGNGTDMLSVDNHPDPAAPDKVVTLELVSFATDVGFTGQDEVVLLADLERAILMVSEIVDRCEAKL